MIRIGICDDEQRYVDQIKICCEQYCIRQRLHVVYCLFTSGEDVLRYCEKEDAPRIDLLFLDIEMEGISGTQLMEQVKKKYQIWKIVFVTSHKEKVYEAFSQKTIGFLIKPVNAKKVQERIAEVMEDKIGNVQIQFVGDKGEQFTVYIDNIIYFKGERSYSTICIETSKGVQTELICRRIGVLEKELSRYHFVRTHKSYLVNIAKITALDREVHVEKCEKTIPIGRSYKKSVYNSYMEYGSYIISRK